MREDTLAPGSMHGAGRRAAHPGGVAQVEQGGQQGEGAQGQDVASLLSVHGQQRQQVGCHDPAVPAQGTCLTSRTGLGYGWKASGQAGILSQQSLGSLQCKL